MTCWIIFKQNQIVLKERAVGRELSMGAKSPDEKKRTIDSFERPQLALKNHISSEIR